jgi:hypothetical protein
MFFDMLTASRKEFPGACDRESAAGCWRRGSNMIEPALCKRHLEGHGKFLNGHGAAGKAQFNGQ